ncbi:DUF6415 family natural product biosynthesis protein [Streptomyces sp. NPDC006971]|uniref:DUF6415 family natural product biosynthesis protein n=1 Tax=Streptomyces sp. NPDC006971 TaxID=3154784 RepID=UPI0033D36C56
MEDLVPSLRSVPDTNELPLDVETAKQAADGALDLRLGTTTRQEIDEWTTQLRGRIVLFAEEILGQEQTPATRAARWEIDQLLASAPQDTVLVFSAYQHLRDLARMLRRLITEYRDRTAAADASPLPGRPSPGPLPDNSGRCLPEHTAVPAEGGT